MLPICQALYIYSVLFSFLDVFSLSSFWEDLTEVLLIWIQFSLLFCDGQIFPSNIKSNCKITDSQDGTNRTFEVTESAPLCLGPESEI